MTLALVAFGLSASLAQAKESPDDALSVLVGTQSALDGDPASFRVSLRGEVGTGRNAVLGASVMLPLTLTMVGTEGESLSPERTMFEMPLSLRGRILPRGPLRLYADAGIGVAFGTSTLDGWLIDGADTSVVAMTRTAVGLEIGNPKGLMVVFEPASWNTYFTSDSATARYGLMAGLNFTL